MIKNNNYNHKQQLMKMVNENKLIVYESSVLLLFLKTQHVNSYLKIIERCYFIPRTSNSLCYKVIHWQPAGSSICFNPKLIWRELHKGGALSVARLIKESSYITLTNQI